MLLRRSQTRTAGMTLIELMCVVVFIGIIAAIALPNFRAAQRKSLISQVKANMHTVQLASEAYGLDFGGIYSPSVSNLNAYYPGGSQMQGGGVGKFPPNPFSPGTNDNPVDGNQITDVPLARSSSAGNMGGNAGQVQYCQVTDEPTISYGVVGMDDHGHSVAGQNGKQLVLSNM